MKKIRLLAVLSLAVLVSLALFTVSACKKGNNGGNGGEQNIQLNKSELTLTEGDTFTLVASLLISGEVQWSVSDETVISVSGGLVTALKAGNATVTATAGSERAQCAVTVNEKLQGAPSLSLDVKSTQIYTGFSYLVKPILKVGTTVYTGNVDYTWESKAPAVATVSGGNVTGVSEGTAKITASCTYNSEKLSQECEITVKDLLEFEIKKYDYALSANDAAYGTAQIDCTVNRVLPGGETQSVSPSLLSYESVDSTIATVSSSGLVTAVKGGQTEIKISLGKSSSTVYIDVYDNIVKTRQDFENIRDDLSASYLLANDIDMGYTKDSPTAFVPFGSRLDSIHFTGRLNGNGYCVSNIYVNKTNRAENNHYAVGVFSSVNGGEIKNISFSNIVVDHASMDFLTSGGLIGYMSGGVLDGITADVSFLKANWANAEGNGGLVGRLLLGNAKISDCVILTSSVEKDSQTRSNRDNGVFAGNIEASFSGSLEGNIAISDNGALPDVVVNSWGAFSVGGNLRYGIGDINAKLQGKLLTSLLSGELLGEIDAITADSTAAEKQAVTEKVEKLSSTLQKIILAYNADLS